MKKEFIERACEALMGLAVAAVGIALIWFSAVITEGGAL